MAVGDARFGLAFGDSLNPTWVARTTHRHTKVVVLVIAPIVAIPLGVGSRVHC